MQNLPETGFLRLSQIVGNPKANPPIPPIIPIIGFLPITKRKLNQRESNNQSNISKSFFARRSGKIAVANTGKDELSALQKTRFYAVMATCQTRFVPYIL